MPRLPGGVRLVVFDLDGTLVDSSHDLASAVNAALARAAPGTPPLPLERVRGFIGDGAGVLVARAAADAGIEARVEDLLPLFLEAYRLCLLETTRLYPGVLEALDGLGDRLLAVLTNKPGDMSRAILSGLCVAGRFARIWGGGDVPGRKPDPAGLTRLLEELGVSRREAVLVGDSAVDVQTGRAAGVTTVGVSYGLSPESLKADPPDRLLADIRDLPALLDAFQPAPA